MQILLIGNGFDLEHKLPTSYRNFLNFCDRASKIYTYDKGKLPSEYRQNCLDGWDIHVHMKDVLLDAFEKRNIISDEVTTPNKLLDELYACIRDNTWLQYFLNPTVHVGRNWIDFEAEISKVIQALEIGRDNTKRKNSITDIPPNAYTILFNLPKPSQSLTNIFEDLSTIDAYANDLNADLQRLIRALEIYIAEFVHGISVPDRSADIEGLNPDHILSFNYSDTYERVYGIGKKIEYAYIHGKADSSRDVETCNLVLGIDEYLDDERKDKELEFLTFKKFYQRIYKSTDNNYLDWIDKIKDDYGANAASAGVKCPEHTLYIFGHSLDVTDRDVLKMLICNDNVQTKIYYYRKNDKDREVLGALIKNLIKLMGQDELLRRTGGVHKTIEFIPQSLSGTIM